jgi:hypothetical protein
MGQNQQTTAQNQQQQAVSNPWAPTQGALQNLIAQIGGGGADLTPEQQRAVTGVGTAAGAMPSYGPLADQIIKNLVGSSTAPQSSLLMDAYNRANTALTPIMTKPLDPMSDPGMAQNLQGIQEDVSRQVGGMFAGAGRDPTANTAYGKALGRGVAMAEAPVILGQYNTDVAQREAAANAALSGATTTATTGAQLGQIPLANQIAALQQAGSSAGLWTQPALAQLQAAELQSSLPFQNLQLPESMLAQIAGLGGQTSGINMGTSTTTQPVNPWTTAAGAGLGLAGLFSMSDIRMKKDIKPIGMLFESGLPVYSFRYRGDPTATTRVGLMAQDVERVRPEAVAEVGGVKFVDYDAATREAA